MNWTFVAIGNLLILLSSAHARKCCNHDCSEIISFGKTITEFKTQNLELISYPSDTIIAILSKDQIDGKEMWESEIQGKRGYIHSAAIKELTVLCAPAEIDEYEQLQFHTSSNPRSRKSPNQGMQGTHGIDEEPDGYKATKVVEPLVIPKKLEVEPELNPDPLFTMLFKDKYRSNNDMEACSSKQVCDDDKHIDKENTHPSLYVLKQILLEWCRYLMKMLLFLYDCIVIMCSGNGIVMLALLAAYVVLLSLFFHSISERSSLKEQLNYFSNTCRIAELKMESMVALKKKLNVRMRKLEEDLIQCNAKNKRITNGRVILKHELGKLLEQSNQNVTQHLLEHNNQKSQILNLEKDLIRLNRESAGILKENNAFQRKIADLKFNLLGMEATRDQLEADRYNLEIKLEKTVQEHCQILKELKAVKEHRNSITNELNIAKDAMDQKNMIINEQNIQIDILKKCLLEFTHKKRARLVNNGLVCAMENENENELLEDIASKKKDLLMKIEAMLKTSEVQVKLLEVEQQRDNHFFDLQSTLLLLNEANANNIKLQNRLATLENEITDSKESRFKAELKLEAVTEYYQQKEVNIYSAINIGELVCSDKECARSDKTSDHAKDEDCNKLKEQLKQMHQEMLDLHTFYLSQISDHMKKTNEAVAQLKDVEGKFRQSMRNVTQCHRRISELEVLTVKPNRKECDNDQLSHSVPTPTQEWLIAAPTECVPEVLPKKSHLESWKAEMTRDVPTKSKPIEKIRASDVLHSTMKKFGASNPPKTTTVSVSMEHVRATNRELPPLPMQAPQLLNQSRPHAKRSHPPKFRYYPNAPQRCPVWQAARPLHSSYSLRLHHYRPRRVSVRPSLAPIPEVDEETE